MKKVILIQSRLSSSRFPRKMLVKIGKYSLVEFVYRRCKNSQIADEVVVITSYEKSDDDMVYECKIKNIPVYRGSLENVLERYTKAADFYKADLVCRVCGDSPFVDTENIDSLFQIVEDEKLEYATIINTLNGFVSEVMTVKTLLKVASLATSREDLEHVTKYIREHQEKFNHKFIDVKLKPEKLQNYTLTVDYEKDLVIAKKIALQLDNFTFKSQDVIDILKKDIE